MPLVFISHKHVDRAIASVIRGFVTEQTAHRVDVYQSSDSGAGADTPAIGRPIKQELGNALQQANCVILVYTSPDHNWDYCMWECGVATDPRSPDTSIFVLQCTDTVPKLFEGDLRIDARDKTSIEQFVRMFMTKPGFLPRVDGALTGYAKEDPAVAKVATRLFEDLKAVLPDGLNADWPTHPYIQVQIPDAALKRIGATPAEQQDEVARQVILAEATISESDSRAHALFGLAAFEPNLKLEALIDRWRNVYPKGSVAWMESLLEQIGHASQAKFPSFRWAAMQAVDNGQRHAPVVTRTRRLPWLKAMQFDVYFYLFSLLDATPVDSRMLRRNDMFCKTMAAGGEAGVRVRDLTRELKARGYNRVPFVTADDRFVYIVHRSMLDRYLVEQMDSDADIGTLTLADLYQAQPEVKEMFVKTAAFIGRTGTLATTKALMKATPNCYDVFVTQNGGRDEPILGWITDLIVEDSEPA